jgi:hypothetical protein
VLKRLVGFGRAPILAHIERADEFSQDVRLGAADHLRIVEFQSVPMKVSPGAATCLPHARGRVTVSNVGPVENLHVEVSGLRKNTDFDFFVIQVPNAPFGLSWYQGDILTDAKGNGVEDFVGRFSVETFIVAPGQAFVPKPVHLTTDAPAGTKNPAIPAPIHTFHLGLWFNSPADAASIGCPGGTTPFNGDHTAGVQVLNTGGFPDDRGPLRSFKP